MHNKKIYIAVLLLIISITSCGERSNIDVTRLPNFTDISSRSQGLDTEILIPGKIFIHENKLIIFEQLPKNMFKVFDLYTFKHLYSFGNKGKGPNEFVNIGNDDIIAYNAELVEIYDTGKIKYVKFSDSAAHIVRTKPLNLSHLKNPINRLSKINDSIYYFDNMFERDQKNEFAHLNIRSNAKSYFSPYPDWVNDLKSPNEQYGMYLKSSLYNSFNDRMVAFYYNFPVMKILDADGNKIKEVHFKVESSYNHESAKNNILYFTEPFATDDNIYVLWVEKSKSDVVNGSENFRPKILVFDWDGNVLNGYRLDKPSITFTFSDQTNKLYCTSFIETNVIYEYGLPQIDNDTMSLSDLHNPLYSLKMLNGYRFSQVSLEDGIDKIVERDGFKTNINYLSQKRNDKGIGIYDLEAIQISVYDPIDASLKKQFHYPKDKKQRKINVNGTNVLQTLYSYVALNPKNKPETSYVCSYAFERNNRYIEISINSTKNNFSRYHPAMKQIISSFELKSF